MPAPTTGQIERVEAILLHGGFDRGHPHFYEFLTDYSEALTDTGTADDVSLEVREKLRELAESGVYEGEDLTALNDVIAQTNEAPEITSGSNFSIEENTTAVATLTATDLEDDTLSWSISDGADAGKFEIINDDQLVFKTEFTPDFENPGDGGPTPQDNVYEVEVTVDDGNDGFDTQTISVEVTDVDEYPDIDVFVANASAPNQVLLNEGDATLLEGPVPAGGDNFSLNVVLGDLDGDGDLDAFVGNYAAENQVVLNTGLGGAFALAPEATQPPDFEGPLYSATYDVALGDLDGDGDLDAFVANSEPAPGIIQENQVLLNQTVAGEGFGGFTEAPTPDGGAERSLGVALGDLDGDGDLDAFVANTFFTANRVLLNEGDGTFTNADADKQPDGAQHSYDVALGDLDGDGDLDAFVANLGANKVLLNQTVAGEGFGGFSEYFLGGGSSNGVALGDLDGDGDLDAFVANFSDQPNEVWLNNGSGLLEFWGLVDPVGESYSSDKVALADLDNDGDLDAYVSNAFDQANQVFLNQTVAGELFGGFVEAPTAPEGGEQYSRHAALGDLDGDGDVPAVVPAGDALAGLPNINQDGLLPSMYVVDVDAFA